jgi:hypothetical protein
VSLDVEEQIEQRPVIFDFLCVAALELRPSFDLVVVPGSRLRARRQVAQPEIELS